MVVHSRSDLLYLSLGQCSKPCFPSLRPSSTSVFLISNYHTFLKTSYSEGALESSSRNMTWEFLRNAHSQVPAWTRICILTNPLVMGTQSEVWKALLRSTALLLPHHCWKTKSSLAPSYPMNVVQNPPYNFGFFLAPQDTFLFWNMLRPSLFTPLPLLLFSSLGALFHLSNPFDPRGWGVSS